MLLGRRSRRKHQPTGIDAANGGLLAQVGLGGRIVAKQPDHAPSMARNRRIHTSKTGAVIL
jgi:hypothetical protein